MLAAMCPVCSGERFQEVTMGELTLRRCTGCGLHLRLFAATKEAGYASIDSKAYVDSIGAVRRAQCESVIGFVRDHLATGEWLDVGCGYGYAVEAARAAGYSARGIEPNQVAAEIARNRGVDVTEGVLSEQTRPADAVSTLDVLEHVENINVFAQLVKRKTRGIWVIKVPSSDGLFFRIAHAFRITWAAERLWQSRFEDPHRVYFNESTLHAFLEKHGFDILATRYLQEIPTRTVVGRLTLDGITPRWKARFVAPVVSVINLIERIRGRSDALLVIAKPRTVEVV